MIGRTGANVRGLLFEAEDEKRTGQDRLERRPDTDLETVSGGAAFVEGHGTRQILGRDRSPVGFTGQPGHDGLGARPLLDPRRRTAGEDLPATGRLRETEGAARPRDH